MNNNDILRRLRYALDLSNVKMLNLFKLSDQDINETELLTLIAKEDDENFVACTDQDLANFLDGLILDRRGPRDAKAPALEKNKRVLTNNDTLKKIRIALELKEDDMLATIKIGGMQISRSELSALFRKKKTKHYKACGDQLLRIFLRGLTERLRK